MEPIEGQIVSVSFKLGRSDGLLTMILDDNRNVALYTNRTEPATNISVDGRRIGVDGQNVGETLVKWLFGGQCRVKLWPLTVLYGAATKAEFTTINLEGKPAMANAPMNATAAHAKLTAMGCADADCKALAAALPNLNWLEILKLVATYGPAILTWILALINGQPLPPMPAPLPSPVTIP